MSYPVRPQPPAGSPWQQPPHQSLWGAPPGPPPRRTGLVVTLIIVGVLVLAGVGVAVWPLLDEGDYVPPPKPKPVHVGISSADLTLPETLEGGALVHDAAGMQPEGAEIWLYKAPGYLDSPLSLSIEADGQPPMDNVLNHSGEIVREKTIACQYYEGNGGDLICNALLDDGRFIAQFEETTSPGSPVTHPEDLREAMRRTKDYLAEAQG